jgi:hypothetical protein
MLQLGGDHAWNHAPGKDPIREADLQKARVIVGEYGLLIGPAGKASETIAQALADGIALGRKEGLAMAGKAAGGRGARRLT